MVVVLGGHEVEVELVVVWVVVVVVVLVEQVQVLVGEVELQLVVPEVHRLGVEVDLVEVQLHGQDVLSQTQPLVEIHLVEVHLVEVHLAQLELEDQVGLEPYMRIRPK